MSKRILKSLSHKHKNDQYVSIYKEILAGSLVLFFLILGFLSYKFCFWPSSVLFKNKCKQNKVKILSSKETPGQKDLYQNLKFDAKNNILSIENGNDVDLSILKDIYKSGKGVLINNKYVEINAPVCNAYQKLIWNGSSFKCATDLVGSQIINNQTSNVTQYLGDLLDVDLNTTTPSLEQFLMWNGFKWVPGSVTMPLSVSSIWDTDYDTGIQTEESLDEDIIRFDTAGVQRMQVDNQGNIFISNSEPGDINDISATNGLMYKQEKYAIRGGHTDDTSWDDNNIGLGTIAFGDSNTVKGNYSFSFGGSNYVNDVYSGALGRHLQVSSSYTVALGYYNRATGYASFVAGQSNEVSAERAVAWGLQNTASAIESTAWGYNNTARGSYSTVFGRNNLASGAYSTVWGFQNTGSGSFSTVFGQNNIGSGNYSTAFGYSTTASGAYASAWGSRTVASGTNSTALGYYSQASGRNSTAMGDTVANSYFMTSIGRFNIEDSNQDPNNWVDTDYLFVVGNGSGWQASDRSNAFVILKNGTITAPDFSLAEINAAGPTALVTKQYVDGRVGNSIFDADADTGIQAEANPDEDYLRMQTAGQERVIIDNQGRIAINKESWASIESMLQVGPGSHESSVFSVSGDSNYLNIATFRDEDGENIFRARGSLSNDNLVVTFGDWDWAYDHVSFGLDTSTNSFDLYGGINMRFHEITGSHTDYVGFKGPDDITSSVIWTLPASDGSANQALLTDGNGTLFWGTPNVNISADNGLTKTGDTIELGGDLNKTTYINHNGYDLIVREMAGEPETLFAGDNFKIQDSNNNREVRFGIGSADTAGVSLSGTYKHDLFYRDDNVYISSDNASFAGLEYASDFSANYTNRSLVDKEYVDNLHKSIADSDGDTNIKVEANPDEDMIRFSTAGVEQMLIDNNGLAGIGTETFVYNVATFGNVSARFTVYQENTQMATFNGVHINDDDQPARINFTKARGSLGSEAIVQDGDEIGELSSIAYDGSQYISTGGLSIRVDGTPSANNIPSKLVFLTTTANDLGASEKMVIDNQGRVGIGTLTPQYKLTLTSGAIMIKGGIVPSPTVGYAGIYVDGGELYAIDGNGNTTQLSPHDANGQWWYNSTNVKTGKSIQIKMESLTKEINKLLGGGYIVENGKTIDVGQNIFDKLKSTTLDNQQALNLLKTSVQQLNNRLSKLESWYLKVNQFVGTLQKVIKVTSSKIFVNVPAIFNKTVNFKNDVFYNKTGGYIILEPQVIKAHISFGKHYEIIPLIQVTPLSKMNGNFYVSNVTQDGFDIYLTSKNNVETKFVWTLTLVNQPSTIRVRQEKIINNSNVPSNKTVETPTLSPTPKPEQHITSSSISPITNSDNPITTTPANNSTN